MNVRGGALALGAASALLLLPALTVVAAATAATAIARENDRLGTPRWHAPAAPGRSIEGYGSELSVTAGQVLDLRVSTAGRYRIEVYRLGFYGGPGARLEVCEPSCVGVRRGRFRKMPEPNPVTGEVVAGWPVTDRIRTRPDWTTGEYMAQLKIVGGPNNGLGELVPFVVRSARPDPGSILVEVPVNTWEAYNGWGGKSLYAFNSSRGIAAVQVSFQRPFDYNDPNATFPEVFEYPMLRFLERSGFPLEYVTDIDVDRDPQLLLEHRLSMTLGHGEYWSQGIRDAWDAARDSGHDLAFLGADTSYWQIRYEDAHRTIVEYRSKTADPDPIPTQKTTNFRFLDPPRPECGLLGVQFQGGGLQAPLWNSYTVTASGNPWLQAAGLRPGDVLRGSVHGEWDAVQPGCDVPTPTVLLHYAGSSPADATLVHTAAGGRVLALGTEGFGSVVDGWGKSRCAVDVRGERFLRAALSDLAGLRAGTLGPLRHACPRHRRSRLRRDGPLPPPSSSSRAPSRGTSPSFQYSRSDRSLRIGQLDAADPRNRTAVPVTR